MPIFIHSAFILWYEYREAGGADIGPDRPNKQGPRKQERRGGSCRGAVRRPVMAWGNPKTFWNRAKLRATLGLGLAAVLLATAACLAPSPPKPAPIRVPSKVITDEGIEYFIFGLKLPGTSQELKFKSGETITWLPLSAIGVITFTGPDDDRFRPADIVLFSGEKVQGNLFVGQIIEGTTDLGYWNMPLARVRQIGFGEE